MIDQRPFLVMDYASFGSLRERHQPGKLLDPSLVLAYLKQLIPAITYAHQHGLIHGNIKPENVLSGPTQAHVLSDFGITVPFYEHRSLQSPNEVNRYLAPEQRQGHLSLASDQYALGLLVYEWLTGEIPTPGRDFSHRAQQSGSSRGNTSMMTSYVEQLVMRALARDPSQC